MRKIDTSKTTKQKRQARIRAKLFGTAERPRLSVYRSNRYISLQVIDDEAGKTLASVHQKTVKDAAKGTKTEKAQATAKALADKLAKENITKLVFDRSYYRYHGRVKAVAEVLREHKINV